MDGCNHRLGVVGAGDLDEESKSLRVGGRGSGRGDAHPQRVVVTGRDLHGQGDAIFSCRAEEHLVAAVSHLGRVDSIGFRFVASGLWICRFENLHL